MALPILAQPAIPIAIVADNRPVLVKTAFPVHTFNAQTDGRGVVELPMLQPVVYIKASDLIANGGEYGLSPLTASIPMLAGLPLQPNDGPAIAVIEM